MLKVANQNIRGATASEGRRAAFNFFFSCFYEVAKLKGVEYLIHVLRGSFLQRQRFQVSIIIQSRQSQFWTSLSSQAAERPSWLRHIRETV